MRFLSPEGMREADRLTIAGGTPAAALMEAAGAAVAEETWGAFPDPDLTVLALCGTGNNGGDGFVAARHLRPRYRRVTAALAGDPGALRGEAKAAADAYREGGGEIVRVSSGSELRALLATTDVLLDALLGTGTRGELRGSARELLEAAAAFGGETVAVDAPSGLDLATGLRLGPVARARLTVTFGAAKLGHVLGDGPDVVGRVVVRAIGLDARALAAAAARPDAALSLSAAEAERLLPLPGRRAHKRDAGVVAVIAGSRAYLGAAALTCRGALLAGAGLVHALVPEELKGALAAAQPEVIAAGLPVESHGGLGRHAREPLVRALESARPDAVVIGPGLGAAEETRALCRELVLAGRLPGLPRDAAAPPLLLDADALNAFEGRRTDLEGRPPDAAARTAMTPHPGELGRLLAVEARRVDAERLPRAREAAAAFRCAVLLKGPTTVVAHPERQACLNLTGGAVLARGGTGDLLSGIAGAFLAKGMTPYDALALAALVHGLAGDVARRRLGTLSATAGEVGNALPRALRALERGETADLASRLEAPWAWTLEPGSEP